VQLLLHICGLPSFICSFSHTWTRPSVLPTQRSSSFTHAMHIYFEIKTSTHPLAASIPLCPMKTRSVHDIVIVRSSAFLKPQRPHHTAHCTIEYCNAGRVRLESNMSSPCPLSVRQFSDEATGAMVGQGISPSFDAHRQRISAFPTSTQPQKAATMH
jgi:hypothetical protein